MKKIILCLTLSLLFASATFAATYSLVDSLKTDTVQKDSITLNPNKPVMVKQLAITSSSTNTSTVTPKGAAKKVIAQSSPLSAGNDAGRTVGALDVSGSGAATYTVPIAVPPGINGVAPQIALTYNSQGGNGVAGYGWNISGLSAITRIPQTLFHDGAVGGVNGDINDRFALDGQRLVLKSGGYGADGAEYQTESYSNIRVVSRGATGSGPQYFDVYYPDGSHAVYGQNTDSFTKNTYAINYMDNPIGARISYSYTKSNETLVISHIDYGALSSGTPMNQISFAYTARTRNEQNYIGGTSLYQTALLSEINVKGSGGTGYRNYVLDHDVTVGLNYDRLTGIQVLSGDRSKSFDPITFSYYDTGELVTYASYTGLSGLGGTVTADFTGDGRMDMLSYTGTDIYLTLDPAGSPYSQAEQVTVGPIENVFPASTLDADNRLFPGQGFTTVHQTSSVSVKFDTYLPNLTGNSIAAPTEKVWNGVPQMPRYISTCTPPVVSSNQIPRDFFSGDFNGDGLTDVISINRPYTQPVSTSDDGNGGCTLNTIDVDVSTVHFINLDRRITSGFVNVAGTLETSYLTTDRIFTADVNGDGKTDIIHMTDGAMYIYSLNASNTLVELWSTFDSSRIYAYFFPPMIGDFNGDGKADIMFPTGSGSSLFALFISKGNSFEKHEITFGFSYNNNSIGSTTTKYNLAANDVNGDGKSDIISSVTTTTGGTTAASVTVYNNDGTSVAGEPTFSVGTAASQSGLNLGGDPTPLFFDNKDSNYGLEYGFSGGNNMVVFQHQKDNRKDKSLSMVSQNGISTTVIYNKLAPGTLAGDIPLYQNTSTQSYAKQVYPYFDIASQPDLSVVSQLTRTYAGPSSNEVLSQYFGYNGAVSHAAGLGFLGFNETTRTNWNTGTSDINRLFTTTIYNPQLRGAVSRSFVSKTQFDSSSPIKNTPASTPDIVLSDAVTGAQTVTASHSIILSPPIGGSAGFSANGANGTFIAKLDDPVTGINDGGTSTSNYITRTDYTYDNVPLSANKVFVKNPTTVITKDLLNQTNTVSTYTYDSYYNVTNQTSNYSGAGTKSTQTQYANSPGSYIGRVTQQDETSTIGGDSFSAEVQYTYTGFLPTQIKRKGNGTPFITEDYVYDSYGNTTSKTVSTPSDGSRATSMAYDGTGRFNTSVTDLQGLVTTMTYNAVTGTLTNTTNPYSQVTGYTYDVWDRPLVTTNYLTHTNTRSYARSGSDMIIADAGDDGSAGNITVNALGETKSATAKNVLGSIVGKEYLYDVYGHQTSVSEPGIGGSYSQYNLTDYDEYGRVKKVTEYTGKITDISYTGLVTTFNDGTKTVTTTKNAMGVVVSTSDPGGTINNAYFGNGNLKSADYGGSTQLIEQDGWGHKTKLTDPSAGIYTYTYNQFGDIKTETTPKGTTTYVYNTDGSIATKNISGDNTSMAYTYSYNADKTIHIVGLTNGDGNSTSYTYSYDTYKRISSTVESNTQAVFTKTLTYDGFGRVATEDNQAQNLGTGLTTSKRVKNNYVNGQLKSITDDNNNSNIWEVSALNARGQVTTALLNTALKQTNTFDANGYPTELKTEKVNASPSVVQMSLTYTFDNAARGNVASRNNTALSTSESFTYDTQDRLTGYNAGTAHSQSYDSRGRITNNSQVGDYQYTGTSYKQDKVANLTDFAKYHYQNDPLQQISYNAFKEPVSIVEQGKEKIDFQYNGALQRAHMYYGDTSSNIMNRPMRRHYSADGSMEITETPGSSKTSFVFYLGGDAYTAPALWKKEVTGGTTTADALHYLLRDHLGSIVMIDDATGNVEEKRQFDAWGNVIQVTDGSGAAKPVWITDRGYTGHEHLQNVGLINMNARLYDPILHRFLAPDAIIQDPGNTQDYNRYAYVLNNPLKYADPSGNVQKSLTEQSQWDFGGGGGGGSINSMFVQSSNFYGPGPNAQRWALQDLAARAQFGDIEAGNQLVSMLGPVPVNALKDAFHGQGFSSGSFSYLSYSWTRADTYSSANGEVLVKDVKRATVNAVNLNGANQGGCCKTEGSIMAGALVLGGETSEVPPLAAAIVLGAAAYTYGPALYHKMSAEIDRIATKAQGPQGFTYALVATSPGLYPNVRGGTTFLNIGDVWKFGQTTSGSRYSDNYLGGAGLRQVNLFPGNQMEIRIQEKVMIYGYFMEHGALPPGNSIFR